VGSAHGHESARNHAGEVAGVGSAHGEGPVHGEAPALGPWAGGHLVDVPDEVITALGGMGRISVQASFNGIRYRGSIVRMSSVMILGVTKAIMAEAGAGPGDVLDVVVENDEAPREVEVPRELTKALTRNPAARAVWDGLSFSHRREYVGYIVEAK
jgi:hypothetical protein